MLLPLAAVSSAPRLRASSPKLPLSPPSPASPYSASDGGRADRDREREAGGGPSSPKRACSHLCVDSGDEDGEGLSREDAGSVRGDDGGRRRDEDEDDDKLKARKKKTRTVFSRSQVFQLESTFDMKRYLSSSERAGLAASLHLTETQVGRRVKDPYISNRHRQ